MNVSIARILKSRIEDAIYIDKLSGMVRAITRSYPVNASGGMANKVFPVSLDGLNDSNCTSEVFMRELVPNAKYRTLMYFEDGGIVYSDRNGAFINFISTLRLVGWINIKKFNTDEGSISGLIVADIITRMMDYGIVNEQGFQRVKINKISELEKSESIFRKYSYEDKKNYLAFPYDFFALLIETSFSANKNCINLLTLDESNCDPV